jgi:hypothetical protein
MEPVIYQGKLGRAPAISANSLKHWIRESAVRWALDAMQVDDGTLSKEVVYLLFSGGKLSAGGGSIDITRARKLAELFPVLTLCGYSAGNFMTASKLRVSALRLVCSENEWSLPEAVKSAPEANQRAALFLVEEFGTRHDPLKLPRARRVLALEDAEDDDAARTKSLAKKKSSSIATDKPRDSLQMIYDFQCVARGSLWYGEIQYIDLSPLEVAALTSSLSFSCTGQLGDQYKFNLGARSSLGFGEFGVRFAGSIRSQVAAPQYSESELIAPRADSLTKYAEHLRENKQEIIEMLEGMV